MTVQTDNLVLEILRTIRSDLARMEQKIDELTLRTGRLEQQVAGLRRDLAFTDETIAEHSVRFDRLSERVNRIERRLDLSEP